MLSLLGTRAGHFRLESGHHTDRWLDLDQLFADPGRLRPFVDELADRLRRYRLEVICGPLIGGALLAEMLALQLGVGFCFAERLAFDNRPVAYRIPDALRGSIGGKRLALVDDAISAGSASRATLAQLESADATVVVLAALLTIGDRARIFADERGLAFESLHQLPDALWSPGQCPMCRLGRQVSNP